MQLRYSGDCNSTPTAISNQQQLWCLTTRVGTECCARGTVPVT